MRNPCHYCEEAPRMKGSLSCPACTFVCYDCELNHPYEFGGAPCLACDACHVKHADDGSQCQNG